jgi:TRAP transporter TAXI family solute receptor
MAEAEYVLLRTRNAGALTAALLIACAACAGTPEAVAPLPLTLLTGGTGGSFYPLGAALARLYNERLQATEVTAQSTVASVFNVQAVQKGKGDVAFTQGDVAYFAYRRGTESEATPHTRLRGMAVLWVNTVQLVVRRDSDIRRVADLRGRRVGVGAQASGTELAARMVIEAHGFKYDDVRAEFLPFSEVAARLEARALDAGFVVASYPVSAVTEMNQSFGVRLVPVEREVVERLRSEYPFLKPMLIPANTYRGQEQDLETVGVDNILVCRADLDEQLVYRLTRVFYESLPDLERVDTAARLIDPERGPTTPIPLHPGAARYYRERELLR